ncbi:hypothetical protein Vafri_19064 [Volvox africanus]|uniref:Pherophorin domain-containing protein n=1 Tax=Volvox africanus TaxID=51714 RepID=A0A8J4BQJ2_9CHLO|nr:hypothetical protein Vafri_19064 [Volvox africanus]
MAWKLSRAFTVLGVPVLALLLLLIVSVAALDASSGRRLLQTTTEFPPNCNCDRNATNSPYRLALSNMSTIPGFSVYCFKIVDIGCNSTSKCCVENQGVMKVEYNVEPSCKSSVKRVTLDRVPHGAWEFNAALGTLRVTSLNKTAKTAPGTEICLFLSNRANCTNLGALCSGNDGPCQYAIFDSGRDCCPVQTFDTDVQPPPDNFPIVPAFRQPDPPSPSLPPPPPPPPPPPSPLPPSPFPPSPSPPSPSPPPPPPPPAFPNCTCVREPEASRWSLSSTISTEPADGGLTSICVNVTTKDDCDAMSGCCAFTLHKVEFEVEPTCAGTLIAATVNGLRASRTFQTRPYPAIKVTNLARPFKVNEWLQVCILMRAPCNTVAALGSSGGNTIPVGLFSSPGSTPICCPIYTLGN